MGYQIEHFFHFVPVQTGLPAGLVQSADQATLVVPAVGSFAELIEVFAMNLGQEGYFGNSLGSFQDCLNDCKGFWSVQPNVLTVHHLDLPHLPETHLEAYIEMLLEAVIRYQTHAQQNEQVDREYVRQELYRSFPSMSDAQIDFYLAPIPTTRLRVEFPSNHQQALQALLDSHHQQVAHELEYWTSRGFVLPARYTD